jgi:hypothetical protein
MFFSSILFYHSSSTCFLYSSLIFIFLYIHVCKNCYSIIFKTKYILSYVIIKEERGFLTQTYRPKEKPQLFHVMSEIFNKNKVFFTFLLLFCSYLPLHCQPYWLRVHCAKTIPHFRTLYGSI